MWIKPATLISELTSVWHTHADAVTTWATAERAEAGKREARAAEALADAQGERESLIEAFEVQESVTGELLNSTRRELAEARTRIDSLERALAVAQNNFEWARVRLNAVEQERALLIERVVGLRVAVPELTRDEGPAGTAAMRPLVEEEARSALLAGLGLPHNLFDDMGDAAARAAGLSDDELEPNPSK
jgi:chromosome segregation ATPase